MVVIKYIKGMCSRDPLQISGGLRYGEANGEDADFYIQRADGVGDAFYSSDDQCVFH